MFAGLITYDKLILVCAASLAAGFIDSIAGGGGVLSLPSYMLTGLPPQTAFACNKTSAFLGGIAAIIRYGKDGSINWHIGISSAIAAIAGAATASNLVLAMEPAVFKRLIMIVLPFVGAFLIFKKDFGQKASGVMEEDKRRLVLLSSLVGLCVGFYDGLIGPGTGTFAIIAFSGLLKTDLKTSSACAKVFNCASNMASMITFAAAGVVIWKMALLTAVFNIGGNYLGAGMAVKRGAGFIRVMLTAACGLLLLGLAREVFL